MLSIFPSHLCCLRGPLGKKSRVCQPHLKEIMLPAPPPQEDPYPAPHMAAVASRQCCVTSGVKVIVTINKAPKSQTAAPCLFPARDRDKLISFIRVCSSCRDNANGLTWSCQPQGCCGCPEWHEFLEAGAKVESALFSTWGAHPLLGALPPQLPL